jgi:hypothetical protein
VRSRRYGVRALKVGPGEDDIPIHSTCLISLKFADVVCSSHHFSTVITHHLSSSYVTTAHALLPYPDVSTRLSPSSYSNSTADHQPFLQSHSLPTLLAPVHMRGSHWSREVCARSRKGWRRVYGVCGWVRAELHSLLLMLEPARFAAAYAGRYSWMVHFVVPASYHRFPASTPSAPPYLPPPHTIHAQPHYRHKPGTHTQARHLVDVVRDLGLSGRRVGGRRALGLRGCGRRVIWTCGRGCGLAFSNFVIWGKSGRVLWVMSDLGKGRGGWHDCRE